MADERFDGLFMNVAQQAHGIEPLMDHMFSFLRRKTDFFTGASRTQVEELVMKSLGKQADIADKEAVKRKAAKEVADKKKKALAEKKAAEAVANAAAAKKVSGEEDVVELAADGSFDMTAAPVAKPAAAAAAKKADEPVPAIPKASGTGAGDGDDVNDDALDEKVIDVDAPIEGEDEDDGTPAPEGNGGTTDKYIWTQSLGEVEVRVAVPEGTKTKMLKVDLTNNKLSISIKGGPTVCEGAWHKRIIVDDSLWTLEDNKEVVMTLTKDNKMEWWKTVLQGDAEINTQKVQPENSKLGDLDAETRQTVEKMMFDQRQKAMNLPSSDELKKEEMMSKFMQAHPEMDFSQAKFS